MTKKKSILEMTRETVEGETPTLRINQKEFEPLTGSDLKQTMVSFSSLTDESMKSVLDAIMTQPEARTALIHGKSYTMYMESSDGKIQIYGISLKQLYEERF